MLFGSIMLNHNYCYFAELFDNYMQQDAHEFLNYLLNTIADLLQGNHFLQGCLTVHDSPGRCIVMYSEVFLQFIGSIHFLGFTKPTLFSYDFTRKRIPLI